MLHGDSAFEYMYVTTGMQNIFPVGVALLASAVPVKGTTMDSPSKRWWRLGRLHVQQHRSNGSEERKETTAGKADSAAGK